VCRERSCDWSTRCHSENRCATVSAGRRPCEISRPAWERSPPCPTSCRRWDHRSDTVPLSAGLSLTVTSQQRHDDRHHHHHHETVMESQDTCLVSALTRGMVFSERELPFTFAICYRPSYRRPHQINDQQMSRSIPQPLQLTSREKRRKQCL